MSLINVFLLNMQCNQLQENYSKSQFKMNNVHLYLIFCLIVQCSSAASAACSFPALLVNRRVLFSIGWTSKYHHGNCIVRPGNRLQLPSNINKPFLSSRTLYWFRDWLSCNLLLYITVAITEFRVQIWSLIVNMWNLPPQEMS